VAAVGLKAGQFPPNVQPGNHVTVVIAPPSDATSTPASSSGISAWNAVVTAVRTNGTDQTTVVSLQMAQADARALAAEPVGQVSVVVEHGGGQ
jgi:hypothetical protein